MASAYATNAKEKFEAAVNVIQSLPKNGSFQPSYAMMLTFYGLFKQATIGKCNISKPAFWDVVGKAKWEAWNRLGSMPQEQAMTNYVDELKKIIETMPHTENVQGFIEKLGDFYELVDDDKTSPKSSIGQMIRNASPKRHEAKKNLVSNDDPSKSSNGIGRVNGSSLTSSSDSSPVGSVSSKSSFELVSGRNCDDHEIPTHENLSVSSSNRQDFHIDPKIADEEDVNLQSSVISDPIADKSRRQEADDDHTYVSSSDDEFCDTSDLTNLAVGGNDASFQPAPTSSNQVPEENDQARPNFQNEGQFSESNGIQQDSGIIVCRGGGDPSTQSSSRQHRHVPSAAGSSAEAGSFEVHHENVSSAQLLAAGGSGSNLPESDPTRFQGTGTNEQIMVALLRLQQDMNDALARLHNIEETLVHEQVSSNDGIHRSSGRMPRPKKFSWFRQNWKILVLQFVAWPIVFHLVLRFLSRRRRRLLALKQN